MLDIRLLVGTLVAVAVIAGGGYLWRAYQVRRTAATLLERAEALAEEGRDGDAAGYLLRYLELCPGDAGNVPVKIRLAEVSDKAAKTGDAKRRAAELYAEALSVAPTDQAPALLGRLGELLLEIRDFGTAKLRAREIPRDGAGQSTGMAGCLRWRTTGSFARLRERPRTASRPATPKRPPASKLAGRRPWARVSRGPTNSIRATSRSPRPWPRSIETIETNPSW